jgi:hypothetical protein
MARKKIKQPPSVPQHLWKHFAEAQEQDNIAFKTENNSKTLVTQRQNIIEWTEDTARYQHEYIKADIKYDPDTDQIPLLITPGAAQHGHESTVSLTHYLHGSSADSSSFIQLSAQGYIPHTELYSGLWSNVSERSVIGIDINTI